jgi:PHP family Zn ribbon phosphoesterase
MARVEALADRPAGFKPENAIPFKNLVPLDEIIAEALGVQSKAKKVYATYHKLCSDLGGELPLLLNAEPAEIARFSDERVAEGVRRVREGKLSIAPGYDGEYGRIKIFNDSDEEFQPKLLHRFSQAPTPFLKWKAFARPSIKWAVV